MRVIEKGIRYVTVFLSIFSIASTGGMMVISVLDVLMRNLFNRPIVGATELVQILNVGIILALGMGCLTNQNISVDFLMEKLPSVPRHLIQISVNLITIVVFGLVVWRTWISAMDFMAKAYVFSLLQVPQWPFILVLALGFVGAILATVLLTIDEARRLNGKEGLDLPEREDLKP